jgi:hypothetical protein
VDVSSGVVLLVSVLSWWMVEVFVFNSIVLDIELVGVIGVSV